MQHWLKEGVVNVSCAGKEVQSQRRVGCAAAGAVCQCSLYLLLCWVRWAVPVGVGETKAKQRERERTAVIPGGCSFPFPFFFFHHIPETVFPRFRGLP